MSETSNVEMNDVNVEDNNTIHNDVPPINNETEQENNDKSLTKILSDLLKDLLTTFPELLENLDERLISILNNDEKILESVESIKEYFVTVFPERFFDILYENEDIFTNEELNINLEFLPGIDYKILWRENISENTRKTMWKYLQLILFATVTNVSDGQSFGDTSKLFEAINADEFRAKLEETMGGVKEMFENMGDISGNEDIPGLGGLPNVDDFHKHVSEMMEGKLGMLAREIAEETAQEWNVNMEDATSVSDVFQKMMKNPTKLMDMVKNVGSKLDDKLKSGDLKESELLEEASNLMKKMQNTPGLGNIQQMLGKMGLGGNTKLNQGAMQAHLDRQMKAAQQKERMRARAEVNRAMNNVEMSVEELKEKEEAAEKAMYELLQMDGNKMVFRSGEKAQKSSKKSDNQKKTNKKKKGKK